MPNRNATLSTRFRGWFYDQLNNVVEAYHGTTRIFGSTASTLTIDLATTVTGEIQANGGITLGTAGFLGLGALETPTIASGVLTVTKPFVNPLPETSTTDQVDSITYTGAAAGDLLIIHVPATNTITFDDANINLGAATRAVAPGGSLILVYDGTQWTELTFTAATDNV